MICSNPLSFKESLKSALSVQDGFDLQEFDKIKEIKIINLNTFGIEIEYETV